MEERRESIVLADTELLRIGFCDLNVGYLAGCCFSTPVILFSWIALVTPPFAIELELELAAGELVARGDMVSSLS